MKFKKTKQNKINNHASLNHRENEASIAHCHARHELSERYSDSDAEIPIRSVDYLNIVKYIPGPGRVGYVVKSQGDFSCRFSCVDLYFYFK